MNNKSFWYVLVSTAFMLTYVSLIALSILDEITLGSSDSWFGTLHALLIGYGLFLLWVLSLVLVFTHTAESIWRTLKPKEKRIALRYGRKATRIVLRIFGQRKDGVGKFAQEVQRETRL